MIDFCLVFMVLLEINQHHFSHKVSQVYKKLVDVKWVNTQQIVQCCISLL